MAPGENNKATMDLSGTGSQEDESVLLAKESAGPAGSDQATGASAPGGSAEKSGPGGTEKPGAVTISEYDEYSDEPDETISERLWGLTEMFPESFRNMTYTAAVTTTSGVKGLYGLSRNVVWIFVSSSVILFAPLIFEVERAQMEDMQRTQQKQVLLGPNTALTGGPGQGVPMPPIHR